MTCKLFHGCVTDPETLAAKFGKELQWLFRREVLYGGIKRLSPKVENPRSIAVLPDPRMQGSLWGMRSPVDSMAYIDGCFIHASQATAQCLQLKERDSKGESGLKAPFCYCLRRGSSSS